VLLNYRDFDRFYESCKNMILAVKEAAMAGERTATCLRPSSGRSSRS
jgi:hypothetical protein